MKVGLSPPPYLYQFLILLFNKWIKKLKIKVIIGSIN